QASHAAALITRIHPSVTIERVVAVCASPTQSRPRIISRRPIARNQPQDFLTWSRPAATKSVIAVIGFLLCGTLPVNQLLYRSRNAPIGRTAKKGLFRAAASR